MTSLGDLAIHIQSIQADLRKDTSLLSSLENKLNSCTRERDNIGLAFWGGRVSEKKKTIKALEQELITCQAEVTAMNNELEHDAASAGARGLSFRQYAEGQEREEMMRLQETHDELAAWRASQDPDGQSHLFPPIETLLNPPPAAAFGRWNHHHRRHHGRFGQFGGPPPPFCHPGMASWQRHDRPVHHHHHHPDGFRNFIDRVSGVVQNPSLATSLVPTQEIKSMLDNFLANLSNQLASTFEGAPQVAETQPTSTAAADSEPAIPGAFVIPRTDVQTQTAIPTHQLQTETCVEDQSSAQIPIEQREKPIKPASKLGKGGFRHKHISCDGCLAGIRGVRYKCEVSLLPPIYSVSLTLSAMPRLRSLRFVLAFAAHARPTPCLAHFQGDSPSRFTGTHNPSSQLATI